MLTKTDHNKLGYYKWPNIVHQFWRILTVTNPPRCTQDLAYVHNNLNKYLLCKDQIKHIFNSTWNASFFPSDSQFSTGSSRGLENKYTNLSLLINCMSFSQPLKILHRVRVQSRMKITRQGAHFFLEWNSLDFSLTFPGTFYSDPKRNFQKIIASL